MVSAKPKKQAVVCKPQKAHLGASGYADQGLVCRIGFLCARTVTAPFGAEYYPTAFRYPLYETASQHPELIDWEPWAWITEGGIRP
jgi:hypothetical protein